jgi:D-serine deaminase-like pyridoxal phosphate-dependent protein
MSIDCPEISVGSTPSSTVTREIKQLFQSNPHFASKINIHPGNYIFYDRMQATINSEIVKAPNMCAFRVLARVISKSIANNSFCIDAGALSLSKDLCTNPSITGYGKIITLDSGTQYLFC